jgi:hypothetical protein
VRNKSYSRRGFILVVSFRRARFKLDIHTVAIALQACFGGHASHFDVKFLRDRSFSFSVTSSAIGFEIYNSSKFSNTDFEFFVNIWGNGGPNWLFEEKKYYREQDQEWKLVQKKNSPRASVFQRLDFRQVSTVSRGNDKVNAFGSRDFTELNSGVLTAPLENLNCTINQHVNSSVLGGNNSFLPGLLPFFTFPSFPKKSWLDESYLFGLRPMGLPRN